MTTSRCSDEQFMALWTANTRAVFSYILTLEPNWIDAEDILQETSATLWEKRGEFVLGTNFRAWANKTAHFRTLQHARRKRSLTTVDEAILDRMAADIERANENLEARFEALAHCMERLSVRDRELLKLRYSSNGTAKEIAQGLGRNLIGLYRSLRRIHETLYDCIQRRQAKESRP